ncbi:excinuclease ABC subunit C [Ectocarpus siliculosus]|uniref:Excinuclease ABC subunit C n=1 Tax=Ectocarpus siliculosus TaxID=2880 RepID=D7FX85_ECTSI|nr:excinuclease ABC subunit C [Ectocarpus siliculosus]|eukprot:CBJ49263.1 excinuclease ABC subunit C [Ectocarpus siliculosus]
MMTTKLPVLDPSRPRPRLRECILGAPDEPGCYIFESGDGRKLYIGKSVNLSSRVQSYFSSSSSAGNGAEHAVRPGRSLSRRIAVMTDLVERIDYIVTASGAEALLLEASLIRQHQPPFNVLLKDDKQNYPYVCVTWSEPYPRVLITRDKPRRGGGSEDRYYGPFVDAGQVKSTVALVRRVLPLRERARPLYKDKPCLNYDMGICPGPCQGLVSEEDYAETVRLAEMVFRGEGSQLLSTLQGRMESESRAERFERAGEIKAQMTLVRGGLLGSSLHFSAGGVAAGGGGDRGGLQPRGDGARASSAEGGGSRRDVVAVGLAGDLACFQVFQVRGGRLIGRLGFTYRVEEEGLSRGEVLQACLERYWGDVLMSARTAAGGVGDERGDNLPSRTLNGNPGAKGGRGGGFSVLHVPEEIVTADALPDGGAVLLAELLSGARKAAADAQRGAQATGPGEGGSPRDLTTEKATTGKTARSKRSVDKSYPPAVAVRVVHGESGAGERHHLCVMALKNAELEAKRLLRGGESIARGLSQLARMLGLGSNPARIEGYDVSHTGGGNAVASLVCFLDGKASPKDHRRYRIRSPGIRKGHSDDYASLREVIARRFSPPTPSLRSPRPPSQANPVPELVLIDGGKGQLAAALEGAAIAADAWLSVERGGTTTLTGFDTEPAVGAAAAVDTKSPGAPPVESRELAGTPLLDDAVRRDEASWSALPPLLGERTAQEEDPDAVLSTAAVPPPEPSDGDVAGARSVGVGGGRRVTFVSLAKKEEEVYVPGSSEPLAAALEAGPSSPGVMVLRQVRDEAHRFAVAYHRKLRGNDMFLPGRGTVATEETDSVNGGGGQQDFAAIAGLSSKARHELTITFGSLEGARIAGEAELRRIPGIGPVLAKRILA